MSKLDITERLRIQVDVRCNGCAWVLCLSPVDMKWHLIVTMWSSTSFVIHLEDSVLRRGVNVELLGVYAREMLYLYCPDAGGSDDTGGWHLPAPWRLMHGKEELMRVDEMTDDHRKALDLALSNMSRPLEKIIDALRGHAPQPS